MSTVDTAPADPSPAEDPCAPLDAEAPEPVGIVAYVHVLSMHVDVHTVERIRIQGPRVCYASESFNMGPPVNVEDRAMAALTDRGLDVVVAAAATARASRPRENSPADPPPSYFSGADTWKELVVRAHGREVTWYYAYTDDYHGAEVRLPPEVEEAAAVARALFDAVRSRSATDLVSPDP